MMRPPNLPMSSDAPNTATDCGCSRRSTLIRGTARGPLRIAVCKAEMSVISYALEYRIALFLERGLAFLDILRLVVQLRPPGLELLRGRRRDPVLRAHRLLDRTEGDRPTFCDAS